MATVDGFTADKMQEIADETVVDGHVDGDTLVLTTRDGTEIVAGVVQGPKGDNALPVNLGTNGGTAGAVNKYVRVGIVDGVTELNGAQLVFDFNGGGNYGEPNVYSAKVHVGQRGANNIKVEVFEKGNLLTDVEWYTRQLSSFAFEVWVKLPVYPAPVQLQPLLEWNGNVRYDSQDTAPSSLVSSGVEVFSAFEPKIVKALLDPAYRGPGPARVHFLPGGALTTDAYQWEGKPISYWGNRVVNMKRKGNTWVIVGESGEEGYGGKLDLAQYMQNGWIPYTFRNSDTSERWAWPRAQRLHSGMVVLSGLVGYGSVSPGTVIATLPPMYRPDTNMIFPVNNGDQPKGISIQADGQITTRGNWVANTFVSLDGIAFPAAGVATWTNVGAAGSGSAFANGWLNYPDAQFGAAAYWRDPYGFVWFRGLVYNGSTAADNTTIFSLPDTHKQFKQSHHKAVSIDAFGFVSGEPGAGKGISWKNGTASNGWISLAGVYNVTNDAVAGNNWVYPYLTNGWQTYSAASFPTPAFLRRKDGLGMAMGLMNAGSAPPVKLTALPTNMLPESGIILYGVSNSAFNRQDFNGLRVIEDQYPPGRVSMNGGSSAWNSWDGHVWMVGD